MEKNKVIQNGKIAQSMPKKRRWGKPLAAGIVIAAVAGTLGILRAREAKEERLSKCQNLAHAELDVKMEETQLRIEEGLGSGKDLNEQADRVLSIINERKNAWERSKKQFKECMKKDCGERGHSN